MARTFNRAPLSVPTPSNNDVKDYFFTHSNFKGLSDDKNFLTVDQETFSDCKNVYMDAEGLLKSRPALKQKIVTVDDGVTLSDILNVWSFGDVTVYKTEGKLIFVNTNFDNSIQIDAGEVKLILVENKIFVFETDKLRYYDIDTNDVQSAEDYIYVPVTKIITNDIETTLESENELTSSYITRYLFDNIVNSNFDILIGKTVTITLDETKYEISFVNDNEKVFVQKVSNRTFDYEVINISDIGTIMIAEKIYDNTYRIYYSVNGKVFTSIDTSNDAVSLPALSSDGTCIAYATSNELYACKVLDDTGADVQLYKWELLLNSDNEVYLQSLVAGGLEFSKISSIRLLSKDTFCTIAYKDEALISLVCVADELKTYFVKNIHGIYYNYSPSGVRETVTLSDGTGTVFIDPISFEWSTGTTKVTMTTDWKIEYDISNNVYMILLRGNTTYKYEDTSSGEVVEKIVKTSGSFPLQGRTKILDTEIQYAYDTSTKVLTLDIYQNSYMAYDKNYPFGSSYAWYLGDQRFTNPANLDMYVYGDKFVVVGSAGEIFAVDETCEEIDNVKYVTNPWKSIYNPLSYGLAISQTNLYYTTERYLHSFLYEEGTFKILSSKELQFSSKNTVSKNGEVLTEEYLYLKNSRLPLLFSSTPIKITDKGIYLFNDGNLYSSVLNKMIEVDELITGDNKYILPEHIAEIDNFYLSVGKTLYISSYPADGEFKWYLPKINTEQFDYSISNIHPISATEMAVFLEDSVYYIQTGENGYLYYKSKIQVGCKKDATILTSYDGKYIIFPSERGLVALSYQDFVASTEQTLTYLSDNIHERFKLYNKNASVKLFKYEYWIICYKEGVNAYFVFDIRNNSWWSMEVPYDITKLLTIKDDAVFLCEGKLYNNEYDVTEYYDYNMEAKSDIDWYVLSQKLHLNAVNYYKHISNITLTSVLDSDTDIYLDLTLYNYRKKMHTSDVESFSFNVDSIRTYVKRLNYSKVNEFQYLLTSSLDDAADEEEMLNVPKVPFSLSSITVKYKISGQVR